MMQAFERVQQDGESIRHLFLRLRSLSLGRIWFFWIEVVFGLLPATVLNVPFLLSYMGMGMMGLLYFPVALAENFDPLTGVQDWVELFGMILVFGGFGFLIPLSALLGLGALWFLALVDLRALRQRKILKRFVILLLILGLAASAFAFSFFSGFETLQTTSDLYDYQRWSLIAPVVLALRYLVVLIK